MTLSELVSSMGLRNFTPALGRLMDADVSQAIASDLPSDVLARAPGGALLVTAQSHINVVAIASRTKLAAVVLTHGEKPTVAMTERACQERVLLLGTELTSFDAAGKLYALGLRGGVR